MSEELKPVAWRWKERINDEFDSGWRLTSFEPPTGLRTIAIEPLYNHHAQPRKRTEQDAWEDWAAKVCPSGDVDEVQRQWLESTEQADFMDEVAQPQQATAQAEPIALPVPASWSDHRVVPTAGQFTADQMRAYAAQVVPAYIRETTQAQQATDEVLVKRSAVKWLMRYNPALCKKAGLRFPAVAQSQHKNSLRPCRSPYCECDHGKCTHPGCYDARGTI